ncbi:c-type cytochrome [Piscinibacter sp.]|uniref:c-type cytochrome n=1 Tax=Piscinibacter sp. TaxID=1903157 RepID=UPI002B6659A4|nr:cytochrome c [Albitalea sp.]HUG21265.1 cytochrome c [Albitalea sp.]
MRSRALRIVAGLGVAAALLAVAVVWLNLRGEDEIPATAEPVSATAAQVQRGAYLARAGNCIGCHTARGGAAYAGGRGIATPFGTVYAPNLTPDREAGIGEWSAAHFWRAMHNGRSRDGRLLYPAFPYPNYTLMTREDSDAIYAFLRSLAPVQRVNRPHELRFPYSTQAALAVWRALYFAPQRFEPEPAKSAEWNRGRYLVHGLGHCNACHAHRNLLGAVSGPLELGGGLIPMQQWYAPSLSSRQEAAVADWDTRHVVDLLKIGVAPRGSVMGPMAEVVFRSTQYLDEADLRAMAVFLQDLAPARGEEVGEPVKADPDVMAAGKRLYEQHCTACHGDDGKGAPGAYPALAGNRAVTMDANANLIRVVLNGGYLPATAGNPRPYGMPPFSHALGDAEIAAVATYVRKSWGNEAAPVSALEVLRLR